MKSYPPTKRDLSKGDSFEFLEKAWGATPEELESYAADPSGKRRKLVKAAGKLTGYVVANLVGFLLSVVLFKAAGVAFYLRMAPFIFLGYISTEILLKTALRKL